jgi:aryl-alcohol dehydrogenase-like predicted oxidoreductase
MEYTTLAKTGLQVSRLCFGTWRFGKENGGVIETEREEAIDLLDTFADHSGNFLDTANAYSDGTAERWIGEWLADRDREDYVIATKCFWSERSRFQENLSRKNVRAEVEGSLERLDTDYVDVLYLHRWDDETPIETTLRTIDDLVSEGKVHHVGLSTAAAWKLTKGLWEADVHGVEPFTVTQPLFHAAYYEDVEDYLAVCADQDLAVCPYSPLAGGFLTGKYERTGDGTYDLDAPEDARSQFEDRFLRFYVSERGWHVLDEIRAIADEIDATPAQVALRWVMDQPEFTCVPIVGARKPEQLEENVGAVDVSLTDEQFERIVDARFDEDGNRYSTDA